jgi:hypothetical protein
MLYREIIAVCSQIHTKHINTLCGQNVEFLNVMPYGISWRRSSFVPKPITFRLVQTVVRWGSDTLWRHIDCGSSFSWAASEREVQTRVFIRD